jgi:putative endonuclease
MALTQAIILALIRAPFDDLPERVSREEGNEAGRLHPDPRPRRGRAGEAIAADHLQQQGYAIIEANYRTRYGELDIIARLGDIVAFVEVKARRDKQFGEPFEAVGPRKQSQIRRMARMWLSEHERDPFLNSCRFRFDVVSIMLDEHDEMVELLYIEDAFW